jgi:hypothetical protein
MSELFSRFEVNREARWPLLLGLIGGSIAVHLALAATVIYVPRFREAFNIAVLAGQTSYVDRAYKKTVVGEDIQMVEVSQKFRYPDGYFSTELPAASVIPTPDPMAPKIISSFTPPKGAAEPLSSPTPVASPATTAAGSPNATPSPGAVAAEKSADAKSEPSPDAPAEDDEVLGVKESEINKRPLKDWLARANNLKEKAAIDLDVVLEMTVNAKLNTDCKLEEAQVVQKSGDQKMVDLAKELAAAIGDSRMLLYLRDPIKVQSDPKLPCEAMPLVFTIKLDQKDFYATVQTEADSPERAVVRTGGYNALLALGAVRAKEKKKDEEQIFRNTMVTAEGKKITVRFTMPRGTASEMLKKQLETKPVETKPAT